MGLLSRRVAEPSQALVRPQPHARSRAIAPCTRLAQAQPACSFIERRHSRVLSQARLCRGRCRKPGAALGSRLKHPRYVFATDPRPADTFNRPGEDEMTDDRAPSFERHCSCSWISYPLTRAPLFCNLSEWRWYERDDDVTS